MTSERVEKIAAVLREHYVTTVNVDDRGEYTYAACACGLEFDTSAAALDHQAEQVAALDGARTVEWGVRDLDHHSIVVPCLNEDDARDVGRPDEDYPEGWPVVRRDVGEWEVAE